MMRWTVAGAYLLFLSVVAAQNPNPYEIEISGTLTGNDHHTYIEHNFEVPDGIERLIVDFEQDGGEERTVIDIGLADPSGIRGWTGSNKTHLILAAADSTMGYRNGPILSGTWKLILGVPNIRQDVETHYTARIQAFEHHDLANALNPGESGRADRPGWYRGDLHTHTGNSDGYCLSQEGNAVPCPVFFTVAAAANAKLDFLAITDHNSVAHHQALRELQPYFDRMLLIPGREITTFFGHANVFGASEIIDFRVTLTSDRTIDDVLSDVQQQNALFSINHPAHPSGISR